MTEQPDRIEKKCWCVRRQRGERNWMRKRAEDGVRVGFDTGQYCPYCGYHLAADGIAYRMVRADEGQLILWDDGEWAYVWDMRDLPSARELVPDGRLYRMIAVEEPTDDQAGEDAEEAE